MNYWMTIDPGINLGWALFSGKKLKEYGTISGKGKTWDDKVQYVIDDLPHFPIEKLFIEWPSFQSMEAQNTGSIIKLAYLIGRVQERLDTTTELIPVIVWKGNLPKEVTQERAEVFFQKKGFKSHAADAVALGQYVIQSEKYAIY